MASPQQHLVSGPASTVLVLLLASGAVSTLSFSTPAVGTKAVFLYVDANFEQRHVLAAIR